MAAPTPEERSERRLRRDILAGCILSGMIARGEVMPDAFGRMLAEGAESQAEFDLPADVKRRFLLATQLSFGIADDIVTLLPQLMKHIGKHMGEDGE